MEFAIKTSKREEIIDITEKVKEIADKTSDKDSKACLVCVPHATCSIIINENYDKNVCEDILKALRDLFPKGIWQHDNIDGNGDAHVKSAIIGPEKIIPIQNAILQLGRWQSIGLAEFDGPRERKIIVKII